MRKALGINPHGPVLRKCANYSRRKEIRQNYWAHSLTSPPAWKKPTHPTSLIEKEMIWKLTGGV